MSLLDRIAQTARSVLTDTSSFAVQLVLTAPDGAEYAIQGLQADIGLQIDPETGIAVSGRKATVAISISQLEDLGLPIPEAVPDEDKKPWLVTYTAPTGQAQTMKVVDSQPDRLGVVVLDLGAYRP